jgi:hypothetical protein
MVASRVGVEVEAVMETVETHVVTETAQETLAVTSTEVVAVLVLALDLLTDITAQVVMRTAEEMRGMVANLETPADLVKTDAGARVQRKKVPHL